ncbi:hypothetical protein [Neisseria sp. Ec49-e6-T10]|uniref:hypothetical protein n=1 Tax=Neisseria sp. Ec49-e6-T10 TaxID=3140744 RepID=UPI003EBFCF39
MIFLKKLKYITVKADDVNKYLTTAQQNQLINLVNKIDKAREIDGKEPVDGVFVPKKWGEPYAKIAWALVELKFKSDELSKL